MENAPVTCTGELHPFPPCRKGHVPAMVMPTHPSEVRQTSAPTTRLVVGPGPPIRAGDNQRWCGTDPQTLPRVPIGRIPRHDRDLVFASGHGTPLQPPSTPTASRRRAEKIVPHGTSPGAHPTTQMRSAVGARRIHNSGVIHSRRPPRPRCRSRRSEPGHTRNGTAMRRGGSQSRTQPIAGGWRIERAQPLVRVDRMSSPCCTGCPGPAQHFRESLL